MICNKKNQQQRSRASLRNMETPARTRRIVKGFNSETVVRGALFFCRGRGFEPHFPFLKQT